MGLWSNIKSFFSKKTTTTTSSTSPSTSSVSYSESTGEAGGYQPVSYSESTGEAGGYQPVSSSGGGGGVSYAGTAGQPVSQLTPEEIKKLETTGTTGLRQEKTISAQLEEAKPQPTAIYATEDIQKGKPYRISKKEATIQAIKRVPKGVKKSFRGFFTGFDVSPGLSYIFKPYERTGKLKGEEEIIVRSPAFGTIYKDPITGKEQPFKEFKGTKFEFAEKQKLESGKYGQYVDLPPEAASQKLSEEIAGELRPKYQSKIDTGKLTLEQAEEQFKKEHQKKYAREAVGLQVAYARQPKGIYERTGTKISKTAPFIAETGLLVGASFTPAGSAIASTYLIGRGFGQTITSETTLGKVGGVVTTGLGFTGVGITMSGIRASLTQEKIIEAIGKKPEIQVGLRQELGKGLTKDYTISKYTYGDVQVLKETHVLAKRLPVEKELYVISGEGVIVARTTEEFTGKTIIYGVSSKFKGLGTGLGTGKGEWSPSLIKGKTAKELEFFAKAGRKPDTYKIKAELYGKPEDIAAGAISKKREEEILSLGGEIKDIRKEWKTPSGIMIERGGFSFDVEDIVLLKVIKPRAGTAKFERATGIKKTPLSKTFKEQIIKPQAEIIKPKAEILIKTKPQAPTTEVLTQKLTTPPSSSLLKQMKTQMRLEQRYLLGFTTTTAQTTIALTKQETSLKGAYSFRSSAILGTALIPREGFLSAQKSALKMRLKELQAEAPSQAPRTTARPGMRVKPGMGGGFIIPLLPRLKLYGVPGKPKEERGLQPQKYIPSLTAIAFKIQAPSIPKSYYKGAGGIILRPLIKRGRK